MSEESTDTFKAFIPAQNNGTKIFYYISATSNSGRTVEKPLTAPAGFYNFEISNSVPVELISFSVVENNSLVTLNWSTATELNNAGFEIQRLQDYKNKKLSEWISSEQDWEVIGFVAGKGTTTEVQNYSFTDNLTHTLNLNQVIHYRLKQIDDDGSFKFSFEIEIGIPAPNIFSLEQNYPNPFNPTTKISWQSPISSWQTLKIYDMLGNEVAILVNEYRPAGNYEVEFSGSDLPSGVYFYQLKAGSFIQTKKMILLR